MVTHVVLSVARCLISGGQVKNTQSSQVSDEFADVIGFTFIEQRPQDVPCGTGVTLQTSLGLYHQDQV